MIEELDIHKVNEVLAELKNLDLKNAEAETVKELLSMLYSHIGILHKLRKGQYIQRAVLLNKEAEDYFPTEIHRISYNPKGSAMGRCNFEGESIFYSCVASEIIEAYNCSAMETLKLELVGFQQNRFVIGNWLLSDDTEFLFIGGASNLTYLSNAGKSRHTIFHKFIGNYKKSMLTLYAIDKFICEQFSKEVKVEEPWEYKISAVYTQMVRETGGKGLMYPSVKTAGAGTNLIIFKEQVDKCLITFDKCMYGIYYTRDSESINEYLMNANEDNGKLVWRDEYKGRITRNIRDYYLGRTDTNPLANKVPIIDLGK